MNIQEELNKWAIQANNFYVQKAENDEKHDIAFYQQSPLNKITDEQCPEVIVIGINPGSVGSFSEQKSNIKWIENGIGTSQHLLNGNPDWETHNSWVYVRNLKGLLRPTLGDSVNNKLVFTNATFFNTPKVELLPADVIPESLPHTIKLVSILNPKFVVALGGNDCFKLLKNKYEDFEYTSIFGTKLLLGQLNNIKYVGIYHTSFHYFRELTALIQKALKIVYDNTDLSLTDLKDKIVNTCHKEWQDVCDHKPSPSQRYEEAQSIMNIIANHFEIEALKNTVTIPVNDLVKIVFVAQKSQQYIYCRHTKFNGKRPYGSSEAKYPNSDKISEILSRYNYTKETYALGKKPLSEFAITDNTEENAQLIINEINGIIKEINLII